MGMNQTETFFYALNQWDMATPNKEEKDYICMIYEMQNKIGGKKDEFNSSSQEKEKALTLLEERINHLIKKCSIDEDFLITGLVNSFYSLLKNKVLENDGVKDEKISECISFNKISMQQWEIVQAEYFNDLNRDIWKNERLLKLENKLTSCF